MKVTKGRVITASGIVTSKPGALKQIIVATDGTNAVTLSLYDNATAASGTLIVPTMVFTTSSVDRIQTLLVDSKEFFNGIYASITCSGTCSVQALYQD